MEEEDPIVLQYKDVKLRESDLDLLTGPHYLNDSIIQFYFTHLSSLYNYNDKDILLVSPTISFFLANSPDSDEDTFRGFAESNQFDQRQVVIFTVNDSSDMSQYDGGDHWSLLVYYRKLNAFVHYDSLGGLNSLVARKFYGAIRKHVHVAARPTQTRSIINYYSKHWGRRPPPRSRNNYKKKKRASVSGTLIMRGRRLLNKFRKLRNYHRRLLYTKSKYMKNTISGEALESERLVNENGDDDDNDPVYREESAMPQQSNLYDCGLYAMFVARIICQWYCDPEEQQEAPESNLLGDQWFPDIMSYMERLVGPDNSLESSMRPALLSLIQHLIHDQPM